MEINLSRNDVMEILCEHFNLKTLRVGTVPEHEVEAKKAYIYWEGNPKPEK